MYNMVNLCITSFKYPKCQKPAKKLWPSLYRCTPGYAACHRAFASCAFPSTVAGQDVARLTHQNSVAVANHMQITLHHSNF